MDEQISHISYAVQNTYICYCLCVTHSHSVQLNNMRIYVWNTLAHITKYTTFTTWYVSLWNKRFHFVRDARHNRYHSEDNQTVDAYHSKIIMDFRCIPGEFKRKYIFVFCEKSLKSLNCWGKKRKTIARRRILSCFTHNFNFSFKYSIRISNSVRY